jgi:hypothetical protein
MLRQLYMANLPNNTLITSDQEEEINVVQNTSENVQVTSVPAVTKLDRQRPVVTSAAEEGLCKFVVLFIRDSLPNEENPSSAAEVTTGRWRSSFVTAGTLVT